ncbi:hypothetical protein ACIBQ1_14985 [Nonomuraea sp. NPDC050153]|uniref:hypothetical protein n=1 Tax=Nonomuraea sp. NPDC050153 TaxID=3364359 RepID=UPI00378B632F
MTQRGRGTIKKVQGNGKPCPHAAKACSCKWRLQYQDEDGRQRERRFVTKREAQDFQTAVDDAKRRRGAVPGYLTRGAGPAVADYMMSYLNDRTEHENLAPTTIRAHRGRIKNYIIPRWGGQRVKALTQANMLAWQRELEEQKISPGEVQTIIGTLMGGMMRKAVDEAIRPDNPVTGLRFTEYKPQPRYLPTAEVERSVRARAGRSLGLHRPGRDRDGPDSGAGEHHSHLDQPGSRADKRDRQ